MDFRSTGLTNVLIANLNAFGADGQTDYSNILTASLYAFGTDSTNRLLQETENFVCCHESFSFLY